MKKVDIPKKTRIDLKETPEKYCSFCGKKLERKIYKSKREDLGAFKKRKYCGLDCMRKAFVKTGINTQKAGNARASARSYVYTILGKKQTCECCGKTNGRMDVHHKDGDIHNNTESNLMVLCRSCHMRMHNPKGKCKICGNPIKGLGYCNKHYIRFKKFGNPFIVYHKIVNV